MRSTSVPMYVALLSFIAPLSSCRERPPASLAAQAQAEEDPAADMEAVLCADRKLSAKPYLMFQLEVPATEAPASSIQVVASPSHDNLSTRQQPLTDLANRCSDDTIRRSDANLSILDCGADGLLGKITLRYSTKLGLGSARASFFEESHLAESLVRLGLLEPDASADLKFDLVCRRAD